jgi:hypothetical protein
MKRIAVLLVLLAAALSGGAARSQALFVAGSQNAASTVATADVFNAVSVALADPGTPRGGTVGLSATASSDRPITGVTFESTRQGTGTWTTHCVDTVAPYACDWDTAGLTDGLYDLRATALDESGYARTDTVSGRRIDNTAPAVTMTDPGSPLTGTRAIGASATDTGGSGVTDVAFEYRPSSGGAWTAICDDGSAAYGCSWSTAALADGLYDLRATATDAAGNTAASTVTARRVDNTAPAVTMTDPGTPVAGTVTLQSTAGDGDGAGVTSVLYEYRVSGSTGAWATACTGGADPFSCSWNTGALNGLYEVRATAADGAGFQTVSAAVTSRRIDNTAPATATISVPAGTLSGTVTLSGTGTDAGSGMASMRFEYKPSAGSTWSTACSDGVAPYSCGFATGVLADGSYDFRSVAIDAAGNTRNSTAVTGRTVDNNGPVVSVTAPATRVRGTVTVAASATDVSGVQSVAIQYRTAGAGTYTTICTDSTASYSCPWSTAALAEGAYELRAVATDTLSRQTTSAVVTTTVDRTSPTATDVQSTNGGVNDRLDAADRVTFTYSEALVPSSILAGWNGASATMTVRVTDNGASDLMSFYDAADSTPLNLLAAGTQLQLGGDFITSPSARFTATILFSGSTVRVTLGALQSGTVRLLGTGSTPMVWQPSELARNAAGLFVMPGTVVETGANDVDF